MMTFLKPLSIKGKIRLGRNQDGGYVVYGRILENTDALITYGVGWEISFEQHFYRLTHKKVFMFDPTMFGRYLFGMRHLKELLRRPDRWTIYLRVVSFLWNRKNRLTSKDIHFVNEGIASDKHGKYDTFAGHLHRFSLMQQVALLKIDIEGAEYDIFRDGNIYNCFQHINQIILELHDLKNRLNDARDIITGLRHDFELIHIHGNNYGEAFTVHDLQEGVSREVVIPDVLEVTLVRKNMIHKEDIQETPASYPVSSLDFPNDPSRDDYVLQFI